MSEIGIFEQVASRLKAPPEEIAAAVGGLLAQGEGLQEKETHAVLDSLGVGVTSPVIEEFTTGNTNLSGVPQEQIVVLSSSLALSALAITGKLSFEEARELMHEHVESEAIQHGFDAEILRYEATQASMDGNNRLALRIIRKAINHATKNGSLYEIATCRHDEGLILMDCGNYAAATQKLSILWKLYESDEATANPMLENDHETKNEILTLWRRAHVRLGEIEQAAKVHEIMYEKGYKPETVEEWRAMMDFVRGLRG